jgi:DNA-binding MarR family transcriptional regulator
MMQEAPISDLKSHLGYWLRYVSNHVSHAFSLKLAALDVTVAEWVLLRELYEGEALMPSELADRLSLTRGAVSKLAERLEAKALLTRSASATDRRAQALDLTEAGRALVPKLAALADQNDAEYFGHLTPEARAQIEGLLRDIVARLDLRTIPTQ